jgi:hypothetical protein
MQQVSDMAITRETAKADSILHCVRVEVVEGLRLVAYSHVWW